jgi:hypothetical protein
MYDFTIKGVYPFWNDLPAAVAQSSPDGEGVMIGLKCRRCKATKTIERSTPDVRITTSSGKQAIHR